jgi:NAD(P)-dependent dehydrogenase (short-subunit alcohol dehydrogenase family)
MNERPPRFPPQHQDRQPGRESEMQPRPQSAAVAYRASGKLEGKVALITGGDSGIGRAVAVAFAKEGAKVAIVYLNESDDAAETARLVQQEKRDFAAFMGDISNVAFCHSVVQETVTRLGGLDILVNNAAEQHPQDDLLKITPDQLERTFRTNIFAMLYMTQATLPRLRPGAAIINSTSVTAYRGSPHLIDYAATKGAIVAFTRSLAQALADKGIRVNAVAPGPIWTPLIPSSFSAEEVAKFGAKTPMGRAGQPDECAPSYVFLASADASYMTGQVLHPNGGEPVES